MLEFEKEITTALEAAPNVSEIPDVTIPGNEPSKIYVGTAEKLGQLIRELAQVIGSQADEDFIDVTVRHEGQHFKAARLIGASNVRFGLQIATLNQDTGVFFMPHVQSICHGKTALQIASVSAYPIDPSPGDVEMVRSFGFESVEELAEVAIWSNERNASRFFAPVPLSCRTSKNSGTRPNLRNLYN